MKLMRKKSTISREMVTYLLKSFKPCSFLILLASLIVLQGCLSNIVSHVRSEGYSNTSKPIFTPDIEDPLHAPMIGSTIKSLVETPEGNFLAATERGWMLFDHQFRVQQSALFEQEYVAVKAISTDHEQWVYGTRPSDSKSSLSEHHVYGLDDSSLTYSFSCSPSRSVWWSGHYVVDLEGDGHSSLALLCWSEDLHYYIAFLDLRDGAVSRVEVPFLPLRAFLTTMSDGRQSFNLMRSYPLVRYGRDIDTPTPIYQSVDTQRWSKVVVSMKLAVTDTISKQYLMIEEFLTSRELNDKELQLLSTVYPGNILLRWEFDGTLQDWWYFDIKKNFRTVSTWLDLSRLRAGTEDATKIAVLYGWGHWCQWEACGYGIFQLKTDGDYKLIDFTADPIDAILVTTDDRLVATWSGKVYVYDLDSIRTDIPWQETIIPAEHLDWITGKSGLSESSIRETYMISNGRGQ